MKICLLKLSAILLLGAVNLCGAQTIPLDAKLRTSTIVSVLKLLQENYVDPDTARRMETDLRERVKKGEYENITDSRKFAEKMTADLQSVSHDLHLRLMFSPEKLPEESAEGEPSPEWLEKSRRARIRENFGVGKVDILKGNVGLIQFNYFDSPENYAAALNYVANTDALIIDLRNNSGSRDANAIPFICSYFFEDPVHLNDFYWRPSGESRQSWTQQLVPGKKYLKKPVYVLTSNKTFSGGEEFTYDLQNLKRATIIGETTGGGAHPGGTRRLSDHFMLWLPMGRAINPVTKTDWEGTGVTPDISVQSAKALNTAYLAALNSNLKTAVDDDWKKELTVLVDQTEQKQRSFKPVTLTLDGYPDAKKVYLVGDFNFWSERINLMKKTAGGWTVQIELEPGRYDYRFVVDGVKTVDPTKPKSAVTVE